MEKAPAVGLAHELAYTVPDTKTVPYVFEDSDDFASMPHVFATAFLVGLVERACVEALHPYVEFPDEITVGTHMILSHKAATPPGLTVRVRVEVAGVDGNRITFAVSAHDGVDEISHGLHERTIVEQGDFATSAASKLQATDMSIRQSSQVSVRS